MHSASLHSFRDASRHFPHIKNFQQKIKNRTIVHLLSWIKTTNKAMRFSLACFILLRRLVPRRLRDIPPLFQIAPLLKSFRKVQPQSNPMKQRSFCCHLFISYFIRLLSFRTIPATLLNINEKYFWMQKFPSE